MTRLVPLLLLLLAACQAGGDDRYRDRLLPLVPGATWNYRTGGPGGPGAQTLRVAGREDGYLVVETHRDGLVQRAWLEEAPLVLAVREEERRPDGGAEVRLFEPGALRGLSRADVRQGQVFTHSWTARGAALGLEEVTATWTVEAVGVDVRVDAGSFDDAVRIRREQSDGNDALLWYVPGVGLVKSEGAERLELLHWLLP